MDNFLSIRQAVNKYIDSCETKIRTSPLKLFIKAIYAGMMIALGAAGSSVAAHNVSNVGLSRLAAGVVFPVGLMMVILTGTELFTGDCLMIMGTVEKKTTTGQLVKILTAVYAGNFIGAGLLATAAYISGQFNYSGGLLGAYTIKVALGKTTMDFWPAFTSGILCNILVCSAVVMALCARDIAGKLLVSFFVILLFVTSGYEHCVANMYYITAGLLAKSNPIYVKLAMEQYGYTAEQLGALNISGFLVDNLIPVSIGNVIGGMLLLGLPMWYVSKDK
ncbi:MAG: formate/nitrite transporter family protein [Suilimivivens sp.]